MKMNTEITTKLLDNLKLLGFKYSTKSETTIAIKDIVVPKFKSNLLKNADTKIDKLEQLFKDGLVMMKMRGTKKQLMFGLKRMKINSSSKRNITIFWWCIRNVRIWSKR